MAQYQMQARSSSNGQIYSWTSSPADWAAAGFPGPGSAEHVAIAAQRPDPGGGSGDVVGPGSAVSGHLPSYSGTSGKALASSGISATDLFANFNVKLAAYGASPSKLAAQNTAAIKAAIAAIKVAGAGLAYIPGGLYLLGQDSDNVALELTDLQNITVQGAGVGITTLKIGNGENSNVFNIGGTAKNITIRGMTLDGNRAGNDPLTYGVHGIRCVGVDGMRLEDLDIMNTASYGLGLQFYEKKFVFLERLRISNTGSDGIDSKNLGDGNRQMSANSIHVENFGLNGFETVQTGFDCRGAWQISNYTCRFSVADGTGIRQRFGEPGDLSAGLGGHRTHVSAFEVYGPSGGGSAIGADINARDVDYSGGHIENVYYGVVSNGASAPENGERASVRGVTVQSAASAGFITSVYGDHATFGNCRAIACATGFRARSSHVKFVDCGAFECTAAGFNTDNAGTFCEIVSPTVRGVGGASMVGIDFEATDGKVLGGDVSGCNRGIVTGAARTKLIGVMSRGNVDAGILAAVGGDDLSVTDCSSTGNGTRGVHTRAARTTVRGGSITGNTGAGFLTEASASDAVVDKVYMSGNGADFDDSGTNTRITHRTTVAKSLNEAVAASASSANIDIPILAGFTYLFLVEAKSEDNAGSPARCTIRRKVETLRSGSGAPATPTVVNDFDVGTGLTLSATISSNNLRLSVAKSAGTNCRMDIRVIEIERSKTVEFS